MSPEGFSRGPIQGSGPRHRKRRAWAGHRARCGSLRPDSSWLDLQPSKYIPEEVSPSLSQGYWPSRLRLPCWGPLQRTRARGQTNEVRTPLALGITSPSNLRLCSVEQMTNPHHEDVMDARGKPRGSEHMVSGTYRACAFQPTHYDPPVGQG